MHTALSTHRRLSSWMASLADWHQPFFCPNFT